MNDDSSEGYLFGKLYQIQIGEMTPEAANLQAVGEFLLNQPEEERLAEAKKIVKAVFLLDRAGKLDHLQEVRRGFPAHYLMIVITPMINVQEFLTWMQGWFCHKDQYLFISTKNYWLWAAFACMYAKSSTSNNGPIEKIFANAMNRGDRRLTALMKTAKKRRVGGSDETISRIFVGKPIEVTPA